MVCLSEADAGGATFGHERAGCFGHPGPQRASLEGAQTLAPLSALARSTQRALRAQNGRTLRPQPPRRAPVPGSRGSGAESGADAAPLPARPRLYLAQRLHSPRREPLAVPQLLAGPLQLLQQALHQRAGRLRARRRIPARRRELPLPGQAAPQLPDRRLLGRQLQLEVLQLLRGLVVQGAERVVPRHFILQAPVFPV